MNPAPFFLALTEFDSNPTKTKKWVSFGWNHLNRSYIPLDVSNEIEPIDAFKDLKKGINDHLDMIKQDQVKDFKPSYLLI